MNHKLNVYIANLDNRNEVMMACSSLKVFKKATGVARDYTEEEKSDEDRQIALAEPNVVFVRPYGFRSSTNTWVKQSTAGRATVTDHKERGDEG